MRKMEIEIPDGKEAKWVDGVLTLVDKKPIEYKFKVGDKVKITVPNNPQYGEIIKLGEYAGEPLYTLKSQDAVFNNVYERYLEPFTQDITDRIKTFEDAVKWCQANGKGHLYEQWCAVYDALYNTEDFGDIHGYFKLRIITVALNEGWEPTFGEDEERWRILYDAEDDSYDFGCSLRWETAPNKLILKSERLAEYAAHQFRNIYADFCGCKKGGEG